MKRNDCTAKARQRNGNFLNHNSILSIILFYIIVLSIDYGGGDLKQIWLRTAAWLQAKVRDRGRALRPMLYPGSFCDDSAAEEAIVSLCKLTLHLFAFYQIAFQNTMITKFQPGPLPAMEFREARNGDPAVPLKTNLICHVPPPSHAHLKSVLPAQCSGTAVFKRSLKTGQVRSGVA